MPAMTRRRFLGSAAAAAAGSSFALLPPSLRRVLAATPEQSGSLEQVEHIMILIQENRSFDHYFGSLSGVRGFADPTAITLSTQRSVFYQPDPLNPDGYELPFHLDTTTTSAASLPDLSHAWTAQHQSWNGGLNNNWLPAHRAADGKNGPLCMGYHTREDIPFHYALADTFTICDNYHCGVFGPTWPNRLIATTGTIDPDGTGGGPVVQNALPPSGGFTWTTYAERLQAAGISWKSYQSDTGTAELTWFQAFQKAPATSELYQRGMLVQPVTVLFDDIRSGNLPQVSWVHSNAQEHPSSTPQSGSVYMYNLLEALASNPDVWSKTVLFITWDENDGLFDHVVPPTPPPGTPGEYITVKPLPGAAGGMAGPVGLGFRVPMLVISPWSRGGWVASEVFDHSSTIRFVERRFGVKEPNISAWRRGASGDLTSTLRFDQPEDQFPTLADPTPNLILAQQEVATLPPPAVPAVQTMPVQEPPGNRLVDLQVSVSDKIVSAGRQTTVTALLRNPQASTPLGGTVSPDLQIRPVHAQALTGVAMALNVAGGWSQKASSATTFPVLPPGGSARVTWQLTAPAQASAAATQFPTVKLTYAIGPDQTAIEDPVLVSVPAPFTVALNNAGICADGSTAGANFDGGGYSYSEQGLTQAGLGPGAAITVAGIRYVMPAVPAGQPDNVLSSGQTISVPSVTGATRLGLLGAASNGDAGGPVTITYTDGSTQTATVTFCDWTLGGGTEPLQYGNVEAAVTPYRDNPTGGAQTVKTYIYGSAPIQLQPGKAIRYITLPALVSGGSLHVFAIGSDRGPLGPA